MRKSIAKTRKHELPNHTKWECKYHVIFIPKYGRRGLYKELRWYLGEVLPRLKEQKEGRIEEVPPDARRRAQDDCDFAPYAVSQGVAYIKDKSVILMARVYGESKQDFVGQHFWAGGFFASTVGRDEEAVREYIRKQEAKYKRLEQMGLR